MTDQPPPAADDLGHEPVSSADDTVASGVSPSTFRERQWWGLFLYALPVYLVSRLCVIAGAAVVAAELRVDANIASDLGTAGDPHGRDDAATSALGPIVDVMTSWDGLWYLDIVRDGYPRSIPDPVSYYIDEARAAFFPLFPMLVRGLDAVLPGGDTLAALALNAVLGLVAIVLIGLLAQRLYGQATARRTIVLASFFPGSFVLSFAYSEALMLVLSAACLLMLLDREWTAAGVFAALATATRPNALALVAACAWAAGVAIHRRREWRSLTAVALAPVGFITFQVWLGEHTGERRAWFRVQRQAWEESASFGWTAVKNTVEAVTHPLTSPTDTITALSVVATVVLVVLAWKVRLDWTLTVYSWVVLALMLTPATVTARPRFMFTAFPLLIAASYWYETRRLRDDGLVWLLTISCCAAGLATLTGLYGVFGAIP